MSTSSIAEGKIKVAFNKGVPLAEGLLIDAAGKPLTDPKVFYGDPPGAILPFGRHKGYGLALITGVLAGALTGGGCNRLAGLVGRSGTAELTESGERKAGPPPSAFRAPTSFPLVLMPIIPPVDGYVKRRSAVDTTRNDY